VTGDALFVLTDLERHLVEDHDVSIEMIRGVRARFDKPAKVIEHQSHELIHAMGTEPELNHTHGRDGEVIWDADRPEPG